MRQSSIEISIATDRSEILKRVDIYQVVPWLGLSYRHANMIEESLEQRVY